METTMTRTAASYYIRIDTYWQNSADYFVGPFASKAEAEAEIERAWEAGFNGQGFPGTIGIAGQASPQNLRNAIRVHGVLSKTEAKRRGMVEVNDRTNGNIIGRTIPANGNALHDLVVEVLA